MEQWKDVVGYEEYFSVSNLGRVFSKRTNKAIKTNVHKSGREQFSTRFGGRNGKAKCFKIHRLVAEAFIPNLDNKPQVNHIDGNPLNNNASNLEWVTNSENQLHAYRTGLSKPKLRENNPAFKLSLGEVYEVMSMIGTCSYRKIGRAFGIHHKTVRRLESQFS